MVKFNLGSFLREATATPKVSGKQPLSLAEYEARAKIDSGVRISEHTQKLGLNRQEWKWKEKFKRKADEEDRNDDYFLNIIN